MVYSLAVGRKGGAIRRERKSMEGGQKQQGVYEGENRMAWASGEGEADATPFSGKLVWRAVRNNYFLNSQVICWVSNVLLV